MAITDFLSRGTLDDVNVGSNLTSAIISPIQLSVAKQSLHIIKESLHVAHESLDIQHQFVESSKESHDIAIAAREEAHGNAIIQSQLLNEIILELKKLNQNLEKMNGGEK